MFKKFFEGYSSKTRKKHFSKNRFKRKRKTKKKDKKHEVKYKTNLTEYGISKEAIKKLHQIFKIVIKLLNNQEVQYWIDSGTLLGSVRHGGMIPWDDDIDIAVLDTSENKKKIKSIKKDLEKYNLGIVKTYYGFKIYDMDGLKIIKNPWSVHKRRFKDKHKNITRRHLITIEAAKTYKKPQGIIYQKYKYPSLDIFLMTPLKEKTIYIKNRWKKCYYNKGDIFPLKKYKYYKLKVNGPSNPNNYINNCYGPYWNDYGIIEYNHSTEKIIKPRKRFKLTEKHRKFAMFK